MKAVHFVLCLATLGFGCSPTTGGSGRRNDSGSTRDARITQPDASDARSSGLDTSQARDFGPPHDANLPEDVGCDLMMPLATQIIGDPPDMLLVVDISGSMCTPLGLIGGDSKLAIMKRALIAEVSDKDARINFGLMLYPQGGACGAGNIRNAIAPRNSGPINSTISRLRDELFGCALANSGATPTGPSIDAAREYYAGIPENPIGRYVLLATDGLPNCGPPLPDGEGTEETVDETVAAIEALHMAGVTTYVIGFGGGFGGDASALNRMAIAGGTPRPFNAGSAGELEAALDMIAAEIVPPSCTVELEGAARDPALFQVSFDGGALIPRDPSHARGWDYDPATNTITFFGADCASVQSGSIASVDVDFGCPGPLI